VGEGGGLGEKKIPTGICQNLSPVTFICPFIGETGSFLLFSFPPAGPSLIFTPSSKPDTRHPSGLPGHPGVILGNPAGIPGHPGVILGNPAGIPGHPGVILGHPARIPGHPGAILGHPVGIPGHPGVVLGHPAVIPGHPGVVSGHPAGYQVILG